MVKTTHVLSTAEEKGLEDTVENSGNYQPVKFNAMTHGILSRHTVLPHENRDEYNDLQLLLVQEHQPQGMTEAHLVEELAGTIWRKQRVLQAEGAKINEGLNAISGRSGSVYSNSLPFHSGMSKDDIKLYDLLRMIPDEVIDFQQTSSEELNNILEAVRLLEDDGAGYKDPLNIMCEEDRAWWEETLSEEENESTEEDLLSFIKKRLKPWYEHQLTVATHHAEIKAQAFGEGVRSDRLIILNRYESHLDRKFQRTLAMLIKLKELRND